MLIAATAAALVSGTGCTIPEAENGRTIHFYASTQYRNAPSTKTEYSGIDETDRPISSSSAYERIDWLPTDKIRIACNQAVLLSGADKFADYDISPSPDKTGRNHNASIAPTLGNGLQWSGAGTYDFYAVYPSGIQNDEAGIEVTDYHATVRGTIPATQSATLKGRIFKPDMDYSYMYAVAGGIREGGSVQLEFKPLVTTLEFSIRTQAGDAITSRLTGATLSSSQDDAYLAGSFSANLTRSGLTPLSADDITGGSNEITIPLPGEGVRLSTSEAYTFTFLTLPLDQTELTLTLHFADGSRRALKLTENGDWVSVSACRKAYFWKLDAPGTIETSTYTFSVTTFPNIQTTIVPQNGGSYYYYLSSYKTNDGSSEKSPEPWTAQFSFDGGRTWTSRPDWITRFTDSGPGSIEEEEYQIILDRNEASGWAGTKTEIASRRENAYDLSCHDIYGTRTGGTDRSAPYNTANCYVVSAPGWYCFPCVYGNAIKNGAVNSNAYTQHGSLSDNVMPNFINHAGTAVNAPWITKGTGGSGVNKGMGVPVSTASLLWQDVPSMISDVVFSNDYVYFHVSPSAIAQGNAVIAAYDNNTIIWSWHIWVMDNPANKLAVKTVYSHPGNNTSCVNPVYMLPMNLGFCEGSTPGRNFMVRFRQTNSSQTAVITFTQKGSTDFNNPYYQWGRKDPVHGRSGGDVPPKTIYNSSGARINYSTRNPTSTRYQETIQNPLTFFTFSGGTGRYYRYNNLWNTAIGALNADNPVTKTIYDPCPPGFKVPNRNAFSGFTTTGNKADSAPQISAANVSSFTTDKGYYFYTNPSDHDAGIIFFPETGTLLTSNGALVYSTPGTDYWSAAPHRTSTYNSAISLFLKNNQVYPTNTDPNGNARRRETGASIRPVQE